MAIPCFEYVSSKIGTSGCNCEHPDNISVAIWRFVHFYGIWAFKKIEKTLFEEIRTFRKTLWFIRCSFSVHQIDSHYETVFWVISSVPAQKKHLHWRFFNALTLTAQSGMFNAHCWRQSSNRSCFPNFDVGQVSRASGHQGGLRDGGNMWPVVAYNQNYFYFLHDRVICDQ